MTIFRVSLLVAFITLIISIVTITNIPAGTELPIHWNIDGEVDRVTSATTALLFPPGVMFFVLGVLAFLRFIEPRKANIEQSNKAFGAITGAIVLMMAIMEAGYLALVNGYAFSMHLLVVFAIGLCLMICGNYLSKTRSNFFLGIRTPWTLSSEEVWRKTHRLGGRLFILAGAFIAIACWFISPDNLSYLIMLILVPTALIPTVYSWWLWRCEQQSDN